MTKFDEHSRRLSAFAIPRDFHHRLGWYRRCIAPRRRLAGGYGRQPHNRYPDRRGNNRIDTLTNTVTNPSVGTIFFIPGVAGDVSTETRRYTTTPIYAPNLK